MHTQGVSTEKAPRLLGVAEMSYLKDMPSKVDIVEFLAREFPQSQCIVEEVGEGSATISHAVGPAQLRPGGTVAGPLLMMVADVALYVAILGTIGLVPLAVTTSLNINFLRKPSPHHPIVGVCKLIKVGRILVVGEVALYSNRNEDMVAHAVGTYSIPKVFIGASAS